jgi:hypothetical protein
MSHHQNAEKYHNTNKDNISFINVAEIKYLGMTVTHQIYNHKGIKNRLNSENDNYCPVQNVFPSPT